MRALVRWAVVALLVLHGAIHLMGAAEGLGWADVEQLTEPVSASAGVLWLLAGALLVGAAALLAAGVRWWWGVGALALLASQAMILTTWSDAWAGTVANLVLLLAVAHGAAKEGPWGLAARHRDRVAAALEHAEPPERAGRQITEADLARLPHPVAGYVRGSGAVGRPRVSGFRATLHGRIRSAPEHPWMSFAAEQVNTFGARPTRSFLMDATLRGLPVDVLHEYVDGTATMTVRLGSVLTMVDAAGPAMDQGETVTVLNDLCLMAPAALVDAPISWESLDDRRCRATYTVGDVRVRATLVFDEEDRLVDFVSDDRLRSSSDGSSFVPQRWSTPWGGYHTVDGRSVGSRGEGHWHAPPPEGEFAYFEAVLDTVTYNPTPPHEPDGTARPIASRRGQAS